MTTYEVRRLEPSDEAALRAWWEVGRAATAERPIDAWPPWELSRVALPMRRTDGRLVMVEAVEDGCTVGAGMVWLFGLDNRHLGEVDVYVAPADRRRGIGRAVLHELERAARADGRTSLITSAFAPVGEESPGSAFAAACGYLVASAEETKVVGLEPVPAHWERLDRQVADVLGDYRVEVFDGPVPEEHLDDFCTLLSAFVGEVPTGDLDLAEQQWSPDRVRDHEKRAERLGRVQVLGVAVAPDGHLCGFSDLRINRQDARHAAVGGTLVLPGHRGHRLGLAMKLATHRHVKALFPECSYVEAGNAGVNAAMNTVNTQLGYRVVERCLDVQKRL